MASVAIVGVSGYVGQETLDRVLAHPALELYALGSDSLAGEPAQTLDPRLARNGHAGIPRLIANDAALSVGADVTFLCLPHEDAAAIAAPLRGVVIDLSGAHRFADPAVYPKWYGFDHPEPESLDEWAYGLPELAAPTGRLVANPGCYATAVLLALAPIAEEIDETGVVVDAMSGMTGAGRSLRASSHAGAVLENVDALPRREPSARARDLRAPRVPGDVRAAPPPDPARSHCHVLRAHTWRGPSSAAREPLRREPRGRGPP